jgi:tetratricopeptide (TPR) repeat protein
LVVLIKILTGEKDYETIKGKILYCGDAFIKKFNQIVKDKERNIKSDLKEVKAKVKIAKETQRSVIDEIRFDTLLSLASESLGNYEFIQLCFEIGDVCITYGEIEKAEDCYLLVIKRSGKGKEFDEVRARAYLKLGEVKTKRNELADAINSFKQGRKIFQKLRDQVGIAVAENGLGIAFYESGRYDYGTTYFNQALRKAEKIGNDELIARLNINLGIIESMRGNWDKALAHFQQALPRLEKQGNILRLAQTHHNIGMTYMHRKEFGPAISEFDKSIDLAQKIDDQYTLGLAYLGKADVYSKTRDLPLATAYAMQSLDIFYKIGDRQSIADACRVLGSIQRERGNWQIAESYFRTAIELNLEFKNWLNLGETYYELSQLYRKRQMLDEAKKSLSCSLRYFRKIKVKSYIRRIQAELQELKSELA